MWKRFARARARISGHARGECPVVRLVGRGDRSAKAAVLEPPANGCGRAQTDARDKPPLTHAQLLQRLQAAEAGWHGAVEAVAGEPERRQLCEAAHAHRDGASEQVGVEKEARQLRESAQAGRDGAAQRVVVELPANAEPGASAFFQAARSSLRGGRTST